MAESGRAGTRDHPRLHSKSDSCLKKAKIPNLLLSDEQFYNSLVELEEAGCSQKYYHSLRAVTALETQCLGGPGYAH